MAETDWIQRYFAPLARRPGAAALDDDVALVAQTERGLIVTTDTLVEGVHFLTDDPIDGVARKLVRVNVSDILAKGALPDEALLNLTWPQARPAAELATFAEGLGAELGDWGIALIGGDTTTHDGALVLTLTLTGRCLGEGPVRRSGGRPGEGLWVTGVIGAGALGLKGALGEAGYAGFISDYRTPNLPPSFIAKVVAGHATAAMDVSDGLLGDSLALARASGCGVEIALDHVPLAVSGEDMDLVLTQCTGGDDYQVLFTVREADEPVMTALANANDIAVKRIGNLRKNSGLELFWRGEGVNLPETLRFEHRQASDSQPSPDT